MTWNRRSFFGMLFAPLLTRLKAKTQPGTAPTSGVAIAARQRWEEAQTHWDEDYAFYMGAQWAPAAITNRKDEGRPCFVFNKIGVIVARRLFKEGLTSCFWVGSCPIHGNTITHQHKRLITEAVSRHRDDQVLYNYVRTTEAELWASVRPFTENEARFCNGLGQLARQIESRMLA
jgi:hypothetical protein